MPFPENMLAGSTVGISEINVENIVSNASNVKTGENPSYTVTDFLAVYPGFGPSTEDGSDYLVPEAVLQMFVNLADASIKQARYRDAWVVCMGFFVAHFVTLFVESTTAGGSPAAAVMEAGKARGLVTSESIDTLSSGYDYSSISQDLDGWAAWKLTIYGQQLATIARLLGKGGMMVW